MARTLHRGHARKLSQYTPYELTNAPILICPENQYPNETRNYVYLSYLNQGGANVVFKTHAWPPQKGPSLHPALFAELNEANSSTTQLRPRDRSPFLEQVLRVNKGLHKTLRCDEVVRGFHEDVQPLFCPGKILVHQGGVTPHTARVVSFRLPEHDFTEYLMEHQLVALFPSIMRDLTATCSVISKEDGAEALTAKRWGILLPDMSSMPGSSVTLEIKPKWLLQSPNAPKDAIRCRTCALQTTKAKDAAAYFCPFRIMAGDQEALYSWLLTKVKRELIDLSSVQESLLSSHTDTIARHMARDLTEGGGARILQHLKMLQGALDPYGVLKRDDLVQTATFDRNLRLAMTLRDCSLYLKVSYTADARDPTCLNTKLECKLGDLDFKSADKMDDWAEKERSLLESDAYTKVIDQNLGCLCSSTGYTNEQ